MPYTKGGELIFGRSIFNILSCGALRGLVCSGYILIRGVNPVYFVSSNDLAVGGDIVFVS